MFCPLLTNKTHPAGGIANVAALGSSSRSGGSPWAAPTLAANSSECGLDLWATFKFVCKIPLLARALGR